MAARAMLGAIFVPVPSRARTPDGYLKPELSVNDPSHGNAAFGAIMIDEVLSTLSAERITGGHGDR